MKTAAEFYKFGKSYDSKGVRGGWRAERGCNMKRAELIELVVQTPSIQNFVRNDQGELWTLIKCFKKFFSGLQMYEF